MNQRYCTFCGSKEHSTDLCPKTWGGSANSLNLHCSYCGSKLHDTRHCPKTWEGQMNRAKDEGKGYLD